ncbi:hypothetical protein D3C75_882460 [compost metagenome]
MPFRALSNDLVVQVQANLTTHDHHHGLAILRLIALLEVRHQIGDHTLNTKLGAFTFSSAHPAIFQTGLPLLLLVFGQHIDFFIDMRQPSRHQGGGA